MTMKQFDERDTTLTGGRWPVHARQLSNHRAEPKHSQKPCSRRAETDSSADAGAVPWVKCHSDKSVGAAHRACFH
jgi:hypothetical protein